MTVEVDRLIMQLLIVTFSKPPTDPVPSLMPEAWVATMQL